MSTNSTSIENNNRQKSYYGYYAGFISRFAAMVIDMLIEVVIVFLISRFVVVTISLFYLDRVYYFLVSIYPGLIQITENILTPENIAFIGGFSSFFFFFLYNAFFWTFSGHTPGKYIMGLRVISTDGRKLNLGKSIIRYLGYFISIIPFGLGFFWIIVDDKRMGFHDKLARTYVIYVWEARPDEKFLAESIRKQNYRMKTPRK